MVIAIIAVLVGLLIPSLGLARSRAKSLVCRSNLRQWGLSFHMYAEANSNKFSHGDPALPAGGGWPSWCVPLYPYYRQNRKILLCPETTRHSPRSDIDPAWGGGASSAWRYGPIRRLLGETVASYGLNHWVNSSTDQYLAEERRWRLLVDKEASRVPVLLDCMYGGGNPDAAEGPAASADSHGGVSGGCMMSHFCIDRHRGQINGLFMDWSARPIGLKQLWTLQWHRRFNTRGPWTIEGKVKPEDWPVWMRGFKD